MKFNYKKISAIASSALMIGMTAGVAAAANYPAPFVVGGSADVAIVYGTGDGVSTLDIIQAGNIQTDLQSAMGSGGTSATITGEAYPLFTSSSKVYMNDSINAVRSILTDTELPIVLVDGDFEGDVSADFSQTISILSHPRLVFGAHPTSDDDPVIAVSLGTETNYIYNATITFDKAVNFTDSDSIGESLTLFGQKFTVGAGTTTTNLYLYKSSETVSLSIGGTDPTSQTVTVEGETYTVELTGATATTATIRVTDSDGNSDIKEITKDSSKKIQGIDVAVNLCASSTATSSESAQITVGADKLLLKNNNKVKVGSDEDSIDGTNVVQTATTDWTDCTGITIQVAADDTDVDAILKGEAFIDPVFGSFKIDFSGMNIAEDSTAREDISIALSSSDKATVEFTTHKGDTKKVNWYNNDSVTARLADGGSSDDVINVIEMAQVNITEYVVLGNEDGGYLLEFFDFDNDTDSTDDDIKFRDAFNHDDIYTVTGITSEGTGTLTVGGKAFTVTYVDESGEGNDYVRINYPDSTDDDGDAVIFPTIQTSKGAKLFFYEPQTIDLNDWNGGSTDLAKLRFPDGDGYIDVDLEYYNESMGSDANISVKWNVTVDSTYKGYIWANTTESSVDLTIGELTYSINNTGTANTSTIYLNDVGDSEIILPAIGIFEEQDDSTNSAYNAVIVKMKDGASSSDPVSVSDVETTWNADGTVGPDWDDLQLESDDDLYKDMDYWGIIVTTDRSDTDQYSVVISYPDEQIYAQIYVAEVGASITAGATGTTTTTPLGEVLVKDSEVSSVSSKNLIIVGGSCINSAAATVLGGSYCSADFTTATGVGSGEFLIKGVSGAYTEGKIALVVAGYEAADTVNAAKYLTTKVVDTSKAWKGTTATAAATEITEAV